MSFVNLNMPSDHSADIAGLSSTFTIDTDPSEIGEKINVALKELNIEQIPYSSWELPKRNKIIKKALKLKAISEFGNRTRLVQIGYSDDNQELTLVPFDNSNIEPWYSPILSKQIVVKINCTDAELGQAVKECFKVATKHPEDIAAPSDCPQA